MSYRFGMLLGYVWDMACRGCTFRVYERYPSIETFFFIAPSYGKGKNFVRKLN